MNDYIRTIINDRIKKGLDDSKSASNIDHPYLTGKLRELVLALLVEPMLNKKYSIGGGKVIDCLGNQSKEIDICIYSENLHPPIFFTHNEKIGIYPVESVLSCIEVKSNLVKDTLLDAYNKFKFFEDNLIFSPGYHDEHGNPIEHYCIKTKYSVFSFNQGTKKYQPESALNLYKKIDPLWNSDPLITSICIAGKGWLCFTPKGWLHMSYDKINMVNEEIIGYLSTLVQDLSRIEESRGIPRIGYYLTDPLKMERFVDGKKLDVSWRLS